MSKIDELSKLNELRTSQAISEDEYEQLKAKILSKKEFTFSKGHFIITLSTIFCIGLLCFVFLNNNKTQTKNTIQQSSMIISKVDTQNQNTFSINPVSVPSEAIPSYSKASEEKQHCISPLCENNRDNLSFYCTSHKCFYPGCNSQKQTGSNYCISHKCRSCDNQIQGNSSYCISHLCSKPNCLFPKSYGSNYCTSHKCNDVLCGEPATKDFGYCLQHKCQKPDCNFKKAYNSNYCSIHSY